jgi:DUF1365 family protein
MFTTGSAIYAGKVMHQRLHPRKHRLSYGMFSLLLDLDEIGSLSQRLKLFSCNRFNLFSFFDRDHGDGSGRPLRGYVEQHLRAAGLETDGGAIRVLCMPRLLGYVFNPLSVYYCHRRDGGLQAVLYEVNNTFGERHSYLIPVQDGGGAGSVDHRCEKQFYVSPFASMGMHYKFRLNPPDDKLFLHITASDARGPVIVAAFSGRRRPLTDGQLARMFFLYPLLTLKVVAGIHWEALLLWIKCVRIQEHPTPPETPVTYVRPPARSEPVGS